MAKLKGRGKAPAGIMALALAAVSTIAVAVAFSPEHAGRPSILWILGGTHLALSVGVVLWLRHRGELAARLTPAYGDVTKGFLMAAALYGLAMVAHHLVTMPGKHFAPWILRGYLHIGDPMASSTWPVGFAVLCAAACEEITWRGGVLTALGDAFGLKHAWWLTAVLYAASYGPTVVLLHDSWAGPNPLLVVGALVGGLLWGIVVFWTRRVMPVVFAHALLGWALVEFPLWHP